MLKIRKQQVCVFQSHNELNLEQYLFNLKIVIIILHNSFIRYMYYYSLMYQKPTQLRRPILCLIYLFKL